jgi:hypothetical protein
MLSQCVARISAAWPQCPDRASSGFQRSRNSFPEQHMIPRVSQQPSADEGHAAGLVWDRQGGRRSTHTRYTVDWISSEIFGYQDEGFYVVSEDHIVPLFI